MKTSTATYRIQLSPGFTFKNLRKIIPHLKNLGISTIYAAPVLQSRDGSTHGYDNIDPFAINKAIGTVDEFREIRKELAAQNINWLQDIVPNHMAFDPKNVWLEDIFELGTASKYYNYFDIDWDYEDLNKVMAPFFGNTLKDVLKAKEIQLKIKKDGFFLTYFDQSYPVSARTYSKIISSSLNSKWHEEFEKFHGNKKGWNELKSTFFKVLKDDLELSEKVKKEVVNSNESASRIKEIIDLQFFLPTFWKKTTKEINYRRFFTINDLICLRMEDPEVFHEYHSFIKELYDEDLMNGLRIDHVDGLFDPTDYLKKLRTLVGDNAFIVVEKILEKDESLPQNWPVQGTTGYEFLGWVNQLFTKKKNEDKFTEGYKKIAPEFADYQKLIFDKKMLILKEHMGGELQNLWSLFLKTNLLPKEIMETDAKEAFCAFLSGFPVYRLYLQDYPLSAQEKEIVETAFKTAKKFNPDLEVALNFWKAVFSGDLQGKNSLYFIRRCQQFTSPLAAKGAEDTGFYIYNRLISHNEVGDSPEEFGISSEEFHRKIVTRQKQFPNSLNATATHDTKRGEDARMRLNVLSEIPDEWFLKVQEWRNLNENLRENSKNIPDFNEEYLIYQGILAAFPFGDFSEEEFLQRTLKFMEKALREAKIHTSWGQPDEDYENAVFHFITGILKNQDFRSSFDDFQKKISYYGVIKSLSQCLIKITTPGIPDVYQGTELWDLSYVDPDNRSLVNYPEISGALSHLNKNSDFASGLKSLKEEYPSGKIKLFCMEKALNYRRNHPELFEKGAYIPVSLSGENSGNFVCYLRRQGEENLFVLVPVLVTDIFQPQDFVPKPEALKKMTISLPPGTPERWENIFTGKKVSSEEMNDINTLLQDFPVVALKSTFN